MPKRRRRGTVVQLVRDIATQFAAFEAELATLSLRQNVLRLVELQSTFRDLGVNTLREAGISARGARERIRLYLIECVGVPVAGDELAVVSGISEYARRVRELRREQGYFVASGASPDPDSGIDLRPDQYLLVSAEPDEAAAGRWHVANRIRKQKVSSRRRLLNYFLENVGRVVTTEELAYVANDARNFQRRVRELRTEHGYSIATRFTGRPDLSAGQYVLQSAEPLHEPHDRHIPEDVRRRVFERDGNRCRACSWSPDDADTPGERFFELHHIVAHSERGENTYDNLAVLCNICHDSAHAGRLDPRGLPPQAHAQQPVGIVRPNR